MEQTVEALSEVMAKDTWSAQEREQMLEILSGLQDASGKFRERLGALESAEPNPKGAAALKIGIARYMVCRFRQALEALAEATDNRDRHYFAALCHRGLREFAKAQDELERARAKASGADLEVDLAMVEVLTLGGKLDEAEKALKSYASAAGDTADVHYLRGLIDELGGDGEKAFGEYQLARQMDDGHREATFRLAYYLDLHGDEESAMDLYEECLDSPPVYANALLNLSVLYEDMGRYEDAEECLEKLLATDGTHPRARLFRRDVISSCNMYYDEDQARRIAKRNAVLDIPVTDFELSVRARNCLKKMNIHTLGDLVRTSEAELLGYKNFGETSLREIKAMLADKGLRLGQALEDGADFTGGGEYQAVAVVPAEEGARAIPVDQVEFSVRARRVLEQLGIRTMGELADRSEAELLGMKNFGQTSLNELRQRLSENSLGFRESR